MFHEHLFLKSFGVWKFHRISIRESRSLHLEQTCLNRSFAVLNSSIGGTERLKHNALGAATKCWLCVYLYPHNGSVCFPRRRASKLCIIPGLLHRWGKNNAPLDPAVCSQSLVLAQAPSDPLYPAETNPGLHLPLSAWLPWAHMRQSSWSAHFSQLPSPEDSRTCRAETYKYLSQLIYKPGLILKKCWS